jgi:hypothetical protein
MAFLPAISAACMVAASRRHRPFLLPGGGISAAASSRRSECWWMRGRRLLQATNALVSLLYIQPYHSILTATLAPGESSTMFPGRLLSLHCAYRYLVVGRMLCVCEYGCGNVNLAVSSGAEGCVAERHAESVKCTRTVGEPSRGRAGVSR